MHDAAYKLLYSHNRMVADLLRGFLPGGAWPGFDFDTLEPLPASHVGRGFAQREGDLMWRLRARAARDLARLQPSNQYVLLDMQRAETGHVPEDNTVALQVALEQAMLEESAMPIWRRVETVLAGPEHAGLRQAFSAWLRWSWTKDYGVFADGDGALRVELDRMENAGEVEAMGSLAFERWKERNRKKEAQIFARAMERGLEQGRTEALEFERRLLERQAARRFGADAGERLSALLAGVSEPERLAEMGDAIIDCGTGTELVAAAERIVGATN